MNNDNNELLQIINGIEYSPAEIMDDMSLNEYKRISFDEIACLGSLFAQLPTSFRSVTTVINAGKPLYELDMRGLTGKVASLGNNGVDMLTGVFNEHGLVGNATYKKVVAPTAVATLPISPALICISIALIGIEKKLGTIQETQKQIIGFLEKKNESELIGNLNFLSDVINNFKYNFDNERYRNSMHIKVLDIKQTSEQNVVFYKKQINEIVGKKSLVYKTDKLYKDVQNKFKYYKLALYQYAFSSFLEILLLGNFNKDYLDKLSEKIKGQSFEYKEFYTECYNRIEASTHASLESMLMKGASKASTVVGETISKVPVINRTKLDESLKEGGQVLEQIRDKKASDIMTGFMENKADEIIVFADNVDMINRIYNKPVTVLFDRDNLYLKSSDAMAG